MRLVYLEAGSGASAPVPPVVVRRVRDYVSIPLIVGGGIRTPEQAADARRAGADMIVVGDAIEKDRSPGLVKSLADAVHGERITAS